jgi:hypothetical protein
MSKRDHLNVLQQARDAWLADIKCEDAIRMIKTDSNITWVCDIMAIYDMLNREYAVASVAIEAVTKV